MRRAGRIAAVCVCLAYVILGLLLQAVPAAGAEGYYSRFFGESTFAVVNASDVFQFAVAFTNTGPTGWERGTRSQINLAHCCPLNSPSPNRDWAVDWPYLTAYATTTTDYVGPGEVGWFLYTVRVPANAKPGEYRFEGDLILAATGEALNREGYFQLATVAPREVQSPPPPPPVPTPTPAPLTPDGSRPRLVSAARLNSNEITVTYSERMKGGSVDPGSAGNAFNYSIDGQGYGAVCSGGAPNITAEVPSLSGTQTFHIVCSGGGLWSAPVPHSVVAKDVQDASGEVIDPNPSTFLIFP